MLNAHKPASNQQSNSHARMSISTYFPEGTNYFYSFPTGEDSNFLNKVSPTTDELVAARTISCAGPDVSVVSFASTTTPEVDAELLDALDIPKISSNHLTVLPKSIDSHLTGKARNEAIIAALAHSIAPGSLVMAQPFINKKIETLYQIPPRLTNWLNDKAHMSEFVDAKWMPTRYAEFSSGSDFASDTTLTSRSDLLPCVVKVSSSSSGDGVHICFTLDDFKNAQASTQFINGTIYVEQYITTVKNYIIHFGIPHNKKKPIDIIGFNEQLTTTEGEFLGGIISGERFPAELKNVRQYLENDILPTVRGMGWYGVGGFDVIIDQNNKAYLIDGNFRMNGSSAYHFMIANGTIQSPMICFGGQFIGSQQEFEKAILPFASKEASQKSVQLIALSRHGDEWDFNGALMYDSIDERTNKIKRLLATGITSPALESLRA